MELTICRVIMMKKSMVWNIYYYNINRRKIDVYNIFDHGGFSKYVEQHLKECKVKEEFAEKLKSELVYFFWCKSEWEIIITSWVGGDREKDSIKIDVYSQVMNNWDVFLDYVWGFKRKTENIFE